ncbi:hypothetical protein FRACYDRAFT_246031 [Fragilariopsis cylindrus CCMP1102]|uniref:Uncharacterized protein n=1 Tax=Fragilariopsis cylindrus CCMP1102 TaxID=635003 RepID=A0A1E7F051_9STRA|nr:hypothetical protein FRACYDRAFT_246031 [Fragilariopsis cylindrus CCMP1102]|eukprot:OEU11434.1 hypothetical protein FRACYDRAFT_246031 [Fragilariopsis cylindrus CCMP1102]
MVGCAIFGCVTSYRNSKLFFHTIEYYTDNSAYFNDDAPSSPSPQQLLQLLSNNNKHQQQQQQPLLQLSELTRSHIRCPEPLLPVYDKIINTNISTFGEQDEQEQKQQEQNNLIPKIIHLSWKSRCISQDMMEIVDKWKDQFPSYNIYIHDDSAVAALLNDNYWYDLFPQLQQIMTSCAKFGSAMTIDIWRILILYRYGVNLS